MELQLGNTATPLAFPPRKQTGKIRPTTPPNPMQEGLILTNTIEKPEPPESWECCESGCSPCVWDHYYEALNEWQEQQTRNAAETET
ncbi:MAG: oxidoreductase-like domain-containing protein [Pseudomonadales bacterium]|nr:oxidoreductase-like domain-containing protein [Pseudomonadales bacterium]